jgi:hypothetical protein
MITGIGRFDCAVLMGVSNLNVTPYVYQALKTIFPNLNKVALHCALINVDM